MDVDKQQEQRPTPSGDEEQQQQEQQQPQQQDEDIQTTDSDYGIKYIQGNLDMGDLSNNFDLTDFDLSDVEVAAFENVASEVSISTSSVPLVSVNVSTPATVTTSLPTTTTTSPPATATPNAPSTSTPVAGSQRTVGALTGSLPPKAASPSKTGTPSKVVVTTAPSTSTQVVGTQRTVSALPGSSPLKTVTPSKAGTSTGQLFILPANFLQTKAGTTFLNSRNKQIVQITQAGSPVVTPKTSSYTPITSSTTLSGATQGTKFILATGSSSKSSSYIPIAPSTALPGSTQGAKLILATGSSSKSSSYIPIAPSTALSGTTQGTKFILATGSPTKNSNYIPIAPSTALSSNTQGTKFILATGSPSKTGITSVLGNLQLSVSSSSVTLNKSVTNGNLKSQVANGSGYSSEIQKRKPCNCTKSQCLKLYCDCFANGEFCSGCNCNNCFNNLTHEEDRQKAIRQCLERNPQAFHPKIGKAVRMQAGETADAIERRHTKGCNCKRSGCLKNYCECYEAKILCSNLCKCCGCKNYEESFERKTLMHLAADSADPPRSSPLHCDSVRSNWFSNDFKPKLPIQSNQGSGALPCSFINNAVVQATCECLMAQAEKAEADKTSPEELELILLEEYGKCLTAIIDSASNSKRRGVRT